MPEETTTPQPTEHTTPDAPKPAPLRPPNFAGFMSTVRSKHLIGKVLIVVFGLLGLGMTAFGVYAYSITQTQIVDKEDQGNFFHQVQNIVAPDPLRGEEEDQINILLLGVGGEGHAGGGLTDTEVVLSIQPSTGKASMLSIPRDLVVAFPSEYDPSYEEYRKINSAQVVGGSELAIEKAEEVTGLSMHYYALVDFEAFRDIIDTIGGLDVDVENAFVDYQYPTYNYGWQTIEFTQGTEHMDGERALQFARSRHGNNGEGSDFARSQRQQKILVALRQELLSSSTYLNPTTITGIIGDLGEHVTTNAEIWEMTRLAELAQKIDTSTIVNRVIDTGENGLVHSEISSETGAYVLIPNAGLGDYSEIHKMASELFTETAVAENSAPTEEDPSATDEEEVNTDIINSEEVESKTVAEEEATIVVQNGTVTEGLATKTAEELQQQDLDAMYIGNATTRTQQETVVYDMGHDKSASRAALEEYFGKDAVDATLPMEGSSVRLGSDVDATIVDLSVVSEETDFIIILGSDTAQSSTQL